MRKIQIGIMGSTADLKYSDQVREIAEKVGELVGKSGNILVYGAEKDFDSVSTSAARGANKFGGLTIGVTYGHGKDIFNKESTDVIINTGSNRGGGREFVLVSSCDVIICIGGGSGTLNEISVAYQLNIPIVAVVNSGGWSDKLANTYLDDRKRLKILAAENPQEAVDLAIAEAKKNIAK